MIYEIYSIGDPAFLAEVMKATTAIMDRGGMSNIVMIGFLLAVVWTFVQGILSGGSEIKLQNIVVAGLIYAVFFGYKVDRMEVWALDSPEFYQVEDVPLGLAFSGTVISKIGNKITEWFEQEYVVPELSTAIFDTGYALKALYKMRGLGFSDGSVGWDPDGRLTKTLSNYMNDCAIPGTTLPTKSNTTQTPPLYEGPPSIDLKKVMEGEDAWKGLEWKNNVYATGVYSNEDNPGPDDGVQPMGCHEAYEFISNEWMKNDVAVNKWIEYIGISTCSESGNTCKAFIKPGGDFNTARFKSQFTIMRDAILGTDVKLDKLLLNRALGKAVGDVGSAQGLGEGDTMLAAVTSRASAQLTANQALQQSMFEKMMRPLMTFFEALLFVSAPFAAILISFGVGGIQMIGKYLVFALWIQLWKPVAAVGNFFIQMSVSGAMSAHDNFLAINGGSLASIAGQPEMFDRMQHWIGVGGMLVASTPMITLMLMYGSAITASSLAGRIDMGKGADVGMDGFSGKSSIGDKGASLTTQTGETAFSNNQTSDATMGSISMSTAYNNESAHQRSVAAGHEMKAQESRAKALSATNSAGVKAANTETHATGANGQNINSQDYARQNARKLSETRGLSKSQQELAATGFNVKAGAGVNMGGIKKMLSKNGVDTSGVKNMSHLGMIMESLSGEVSTGADYQERFSKAANETRGLSDSVDKAWSESESERQSWGTQFAATDSEAVTQSEDYQQAASHTQSAEQSVAKKRAAETKATNAEKKSKSGAHQQNFELATLSADVNNKGSMEQFGAFLSAKANQGDQTYANVPNTVAGFRGALISAVQGGKSSDAQELLSIAGHDASQGAEFSGVGSNLTDAIEQHGHTALHSEDPIVMPAQQSQAASDMSAGVQNTLKNSGGATDKQQAAISKGAGRELSKKESRQAGQAAALASAGGMSNREEEGIRNMLNKAGVSSSEATSGGQLALAVAGMGEKIAQGMTPQKAFDASLDESKEMADLGESVGTASQDTGGAEPITSGDGSTGGGSAGGGAAGGSTGGGLGFMSAPKMTEAAETLGAELVAPVSGDGSDYSLESLGSDNLDQAYSDAKEKYPNLQMNPETWTPEQAREIGQAAGILDESDWNGVEKTPEEFNANADAAYDNSDLHGEGNRAKDLFAIGRSGAAEHAADTAAKGAEVGMVGGAAVGGAAAANATRNAAMRSTVMRKSGISALKAITRGAIGGSLIGGPAGTVVGLLAGAADAYGIYQDYQTTQETNQASTELAEGGVSNLSEDSHDVVNNTLEGVIGKQAHAMAAAHRKGEEFNHGEFMDGLSDFEQQVYGHGEELMDAGYGSGLGEKMDDALQSAAAQEKEEHTQTMLHKRY